jgi:hypothetical protein
MKNPTRPPTLGTLGIVVLMLIMNYSLVFCGADSVRLGIPLKMNKTISGYIGSKFNLGDSEFFREYARAFHTNNIFMVQPVVGIALRAEPISRIRFGVSGEYFRARYYDNFTQAAFSPIDSSPVGFRTATESIEFNAIPLLLTVDLIPSVNQFRTYTGVGIGLSIGHIRWEEGISTTVKNDRRVGGIVYDDNTLSPAACLYAGIELGFDKRKKDDNFISFTIEARYTYIGMSAPMFKAISSQFFRPPDSWKENYSVGASAFSLQFGLSFQSPNI